MAMLAGAVAVLLAGTFAGGALCAWALCGMAAQDAASLPGASETMPHSARILAAIPCGTLPFAAALAFMPDPATCGAAQALGEAMRMAAAAGAATASAAAGVGAFRSMTAILSR